MPHKRWIALILGVLLLLIVLASLDRSAKWEGIDTAVVGKYATELGQEPQRPLINLSGDSLLFAFTSSAAIAGFAAGYYWRQLFGSDRTRSMRDERAQPRADLEAKTDV